MSKQLLENARIIIEPCPKCETRYFLDVILSEFNRYFIVCKKCKVSHVSFPTVKEAIRHWNKFCRSSDSTSKK